MVTTAGEVEGMVEKEGVIEFEFGQWNLFIQEGRSSNLKNC